MKLGALERNRGGGVNVALRMLIILWLFVSVLGEGGGKLDLVSSSINSFTQNEVCGTCCVPRTDTLGHNTAAWERDGALRTTLLETFLWAAPTPPGI